MDKTSKDTGEKNYYRSEYEPNKIIVDVRFLQMLPQSHIRFGCSEIIKHGVYQSHALLEYLASNDFDPITDEESLLKAICWTVALKNVVTTYDPDSLSYGGTILRGGHTMARMIEGKFSTVSHGEAVAVGVYQDTKINAKIHELVERIYQKLHLPKDELELITHSY